MKEIDIATVLATKRKGKGITQGELASYMGVSKASVSKWETGQSYPDIVFLPQLAAYFNMSIDELMGYAPQMSKEGIRSLYLELTTAFAEDPFEAAFAQAEAAVKKYYSCFPLLMQMVLLYVNHFMLAPDAATREAVLEKAGELCRRIKAESSDTWLCQQANSAEALTYLMAGNPAEVLDLLDGVIRPRPNDEPLLANAYLMTGRIDKAQEVLQIGLYQSVIGIIGNAPLLLSAYADTADRFEEIVRRMEALIKDFALDELAPHATAPLYLTIAQCYAARRPAEAADDDRQIIESANTKMTFLFLKRYADACASLKYPWKLHGDGFFDLVAEWFDDFDLGGTAPRDEKVIKESALQGIEANPAFAALAEIPEYKNILEGLRTRLDDTEGE